jgi:hypothetical protein
MKYGYKIAEINTVPGADTRGGGGGGGGLSHPIILIDCKNLVANNTNHTHIIIPLIKTL